MKRQIPTRAETIAEIFNCAVNWISADADRPESLPPEWREVMEWIEKTPGALQDCLSAMDALRHQVEQMRGMIKDEDGTLQEACAAHDEVAERIRKMVP
ncbi:MAG: hypothetical protein J0H19_25425 [Rhodospirillales bacterium]|nr:hypothetical protein [Rhodospirillales bacterium]